jgi:hypothetical protein
MSRISSYIVAIALLSACAGGTGGTGSQGPVGPEGPQGPAGTVGPQGQTGAVGPQGLAGTTGPAGAGGVQGPAGAQGPAGSTGAVGPQGLVGPLGPRGLQGVAGPLGPQGLDGAQGPAGTQGAVGAVGGRGDPGPVGPPGQLFVPATGATATLVAGSVTTADTDSTRLVTGTSDVCGGSSCVVADGPFVLTDARSVDGANITWLVQVDAGTDCAGLCNSPGALVPTSGMPLVGLSANTTVRNGLMSLSDHLSGSRFALAAGKRLCACAIRTGPGGFPPAWKAWWSGFVPYQ